MRIVLAVLLIALVAQVSNAAPIQRSKRDNAPQKDAFQLVQQLVANIKTIAEGVLQDMPSSDAYGKHKQDWVDFLQLYDVSDKLCIEKLTDIIEKFTELTDKYVEDNATEEEEELAKLFVDHGLLDAIEQFKIAVKTAKDPENEMDFYEKC